MANPAASQANADQTVVRSVDVNGNVQDLLRLNERAVQVVTDAEGALHVFGVSGYDPMGASERRVELWHRSYDGRAWSVRESLLRARLINWPASGRAAAAGHNNVVHLVVPFADSAGNMGLFYVRGNTGRWQSTVPVKTLAAVATIAVLPHQEIMIAYLHGSRRSGGVNNVYAALVDTAASGSRTALIHKTGDEPALTVSLIPTGGASLRVVFSQRTRAGGLAIKEARSEDGGVTWDTAYTRITVQKSIRVAAGLGRCSDPAIVVSYANDRNLPELGILERNELSSVGITGTPIDYGLGSGSGGEVLLVTSELGADGYRWVIRKSQD